LKIRKYILTTFIISKAVTCPPNIVPGLMLE
jgi:hypothetical protein